MERKQKITRSGYWIKNIVLVGIFIAAALTHAEQECFRSSECDEGYRCMEIQGSAMGLCKAERDDLRERRARDTENFNPWTQSGGISAYHSDDNFNDNDNSNDGE